ncbi:MULTISPECIES: LON peptidase substrate-binding domain-containing protein [unclassified Mesorhizobium]|uniref:LON peptidase substrate-binding domain-containing protein n=1 Tax=unclassified Mesorhizobium TaxID=325217 RepID=UPI002416B710|nr:MULTISPECIES: LON peptidase substrate-binding domain-containing protein [unclassified Mesorhizobium]WFP62099.1 LON peptidase substrate-binding domain-containing protein [Mesorhizobium sp. WSM4904]WFP75371.1 LON peptidase substrate-binding domain-containing protein [Mesorhizobium sp. WSM4906]
MRDFRDAKAMAQTLTAALAAKSVSLSHSESLELISKILGFRDWNVLAARIQASQRTGAPGLSDGVTTPPSFAQADIPIFPMRDLVLFPQTITPVFVARDRTRRAVERAMAGDRRVLVVAQRRGADNDPSTLESLYSAGVTANVINSQTQVDGVLKVSVSALQRAAITRLIVGEFLAAEVEPIEEQRGLSEEAAALSRAVLDAYRIYANVDLSSLPLQQRVRFGLPSAENPGLLADTVAQSLSIGIEQKQQLLETGDVVVRLAKILDLMSAGRPEK